MVPEAVHARIKGVTSLNQAKRILKSLTDTRDLHCGVLYRNRRCWLPAEQARALSEDAKIRHFASLVFCCLQGKTRVRLTPADYHQHFPDLLRHGGSTQHYIETFESSATLGYLRVDAGNHGRWDRIVAKARDDVRAHLARSAYQPFIESGSIEVHIVTALPAKAARIERTLQETPQRLPIPIRVTAIPALINLIAPLPV
jgi:hypothetical protein